MRERNGARSNKHKKRTNLLYLVKGERKGSGKPWRGNPAGGQRDYAARLPPRRRWEAETTHLLIVRKRKNGGRRLAAQGEKQNRRKATEGVRN